LHVSAVLARLPALHVSAVLARLPALHVSAVLARLPALHVSAVLGCLGLVGLRAGVRAAVRASGQEDYRQDGSREFRGVMFADRSHALYGPRPYSGGKVVFLGDTSQIDNPYVSSDTNALSILMEKFKGQSMFGGLTLTKGERSKVASLTGTIL